MKRGKVSPLRERGWRCGCSEPPRCEPKIKQLIERKTDTMKTYILREPDSVEPQKAQCVQTPPTSLANTAWQNSPLRALFIGVDVDNDSIAVSLAPADATVRVTALRSTESE